MKVLWFGYGSKTTGVDEGVAGLYADAGRRFPMDLRIVTAGVQGIKRYCEKSTRRSGAALTLKYVPWSSAETWNSLGATDTCADSSDARRAMDARQERQPDSRGAVGRPVCRRPPNSFFSQFADYAWLGADLAEGISWVMRNQESIAGRIRAAQDRIAAAYLRTASRRNGSGYLKWLNPGCGR